MSQGLSESPPSDSDGSCGIDEPPVSSDDLRVLIVTEHASTQFGGEAMLPLHYFRILRQREIPVWLVTHERTRTELQALFPEDGDRIFYVKDTFWHHLFWQLGQRLPGAIAYFTTGFMMRLMTQMAQRRIARCLVQTESISIIHQPIPVSPKEPSLLFDLGAPVVIGPMNGSMDYPPGFCQQQSGIVTVAIALGRKTANVMNRLLPGKCRAAMLLVANERTRQALPHGACNQVVELVENGVDLSLWQPVQETERSPSSVTRYVFIGRLVDWKAVDLLLLAFDQAKSQTSISLTIIGDGVERDALEQQARNLDLLADTVDQPGKVCFLGWMSQKDCSEQLRRSDALVLPSLRECGGAVVLEAMAMGIPVIATAWGGPADYLDETCGILVEPLSREIFIENLAGAMERLAQSVEVREAMGAAGRNKVVQMFDWEVKGDRMVELYRKVLAHDLVDIKGLDRLKPRSHAGLERCE